MARIGGVQGAGTDNWQIKQKQAEQTNGPNKINTGFIPMVDTNKAEDAKGVNKAQEVQDTPSVKSAKQEINNEFRGLGCTVQWNGNTATIVSSQGTKAEVSIVEGGIQPGAGFDKLADELLGEPNKKMNEFIKAQEKNGNPIVGDSFQTTILCGGKNVEVLAFKTQNGGELYLNSKGEQVFRDDKKTS